MRKNTQQLNTLSATEMARQVRARQLTATALLQSHLQRIEALDTEIGAYQLVRAEQSLYEAGQLDQRADLSDLPLAGVPVAVKDNIDIRGEPTRFGSAASPAMPAEQDDELIHRLRSAGAIIIGKTKLPELAIWPFTESTAFGDSCNPHNTTRTPGGSSGGSAAAVAANMAALAIGSDGGGSIRIPAACCGLYGLKPGPGLVPLAGGASEHWLGMSEFGPLARSTNDLRLMLDVLAGSSRPSHTQPRRQGLRIALSTRPVLPGTVIDDEVLEALQHCGQQLTAAGHQLQITDPPYPATLPVRYLQRWLAGIAEDAERFPAGQLEARTRNIASTGSWLHRLGLTPGASLDGFGDIMQSWFDNVDVLLMPTLARPAVALGEWRDKGWIRTAIGAGNWVQTSPWNLARLPAASCPAGLSSDGLPIGVQLVTARGNEAVLLSVMADLEAARR